MSRIWYRTKSGVFFPAEDSNLSLHFKSLKQFSKIASTIYWVKGILKILIPFLRMIWLYTYTGKYSSYVLATRCADHLSQKLTLLMFVLNNLHIKILIIYCNTHTYTYTPLPPQSDETTGLRNQSRGSGQKRKELETKKYVHKHIHIIIIETFPV